MQQYALVSVIITLSVLGFVHGKEIVSSNKSRRFLKERNLQVSTEVEEAINQLPGW